LKAAVGGAAAAGWDGEKHRSSYIRLEPHSFPFIPFSMEFYGWLGRPGIPLLGPVGGEAEERGRFFSKSSFVASEIREIRDF
jgi:hypothetical protein